MITKWKYHTNQMEFKLTMFVWLSVLAVAITSCNADFASEMLAQHNRLRATHSAPPLSLDAGLTKVAQKWADHLAGLSVSYPVLKHRNWKDLRKEAKRFGLLSIGENLAYAKGISNGFSFTDMWYSEAKDYTFYGSEPPSGNFKTTGHFTQVVWASTTKLGVGVADVPELGGKIVVANYSPAGNWRGGYTNNVLPPSRKRPKKTKTRY